MDIKGLEPQRLQRYAFNERSVRCVNIVHEGWNAIRTSEFRSVPLRFIDN